MRPISDGLGSHSRLLAWAPHQLWSRLEGMGKHGHTGPGHQGSFCLSQVVQRTPMCIYFPGTSDIGHRRGFALCS